MKEQTSWIVYGKHSGENEYRPLSAFDTGVEAQDFCKIYSENNGLKALSLAIKRGCVGCVNIQYRSFPFDNSEGKYFIDSEGCGLVQGGRDYDLQIFYCPVCGEKLE